MVSELLFRLSVPPLRGCEPGLPHRSERRYALAFLSPRHSRIITRAAQNDSRTLC